MKNFKNIFRIWILLIFIGLLFMAEKSFSQELYLPKPKKERVNDWFYLEDAGTLIFSGFAGFCYGMREASHAEPKVFETPCNKTRFPVCGKSPTSFYGSQQDRRKYDENGKMKTQLFGNFGRDLWHTADKVSRLSIALSVAVPLCGKTGKTEKWLKVGANFGAYSLGYFYGYNMPRNHE
jgi:hypothetical protein